LQLQILHLLSFNSHPVELAEVVGQEREKKADEKKSMLARSLEDKQNLSNAKYNTHTFSGVRYAFQSLGFFSCGGGRFEAQFRSFCTQCEVACV
jgi:hypothetical protein